MQKIFILLFSIFIGINISAQENNFKTADYSKPKKYIINDIKITGVKYLDTDVLLHIADFRVGDEIDIPGDEFTATIKKYLKQKLFSNVEIYYIPREENKVDIVINLVEQPRLSKLTINGIRNGEVKTVKEKLHLRIGDQVTEDLSSNYKRIIVDHFLEKGFYNVNVDVRTKNDTTFKNTVELIFDVKKGKRVKIKEITFEGNKEVKDKKLRRWMKNTKTTSIINIMKKSKLNKDEFEEDKQTLIEKYKSNGYRDAKYISDSVYLIKKKRLGLKIKVDEGKKFYFRNISWIGNTVFPSEYLSDVLNIKKGSAYNKTLLEDRLNVEEDAISAVYMDRGYLFFNVQPIETKVEGDSIDLELRIYEGEQATINKIIILGNTKTNEHVVRREIRTKPGELFNRSKIIRTQRELAALGHFDPETMRVEPIPHQEDNTVDIKYVLEEKANDQLEISGGWGGGMLVGSLGVRFTNFSARRLFKPKEWNSIIPTGDGQTLSLRGQTNGRYYSSISVSFMEPWLGGRKPNSLSVSFQYSAYSKYNYYSQNTGDDGSFEVIGASVGLGKRLEWPDNYFTMRNDISYQRYNLTNYEMGFGFDNGSSNILSYAFTLGRNSVDNPLFPRGGSEFSISARLTPPYSLFKKDNFWKLTAVEKATAIANKDANQSNESAILEQESQNRYKMIEFHKWDFKATWYKKLIDNLVLSTSIKFGYLGYYSSNLGYSPFEKFQLGGDGMSGYNMYGVDNIGLRGYSNNSLTSEERYMDPLTGAERTRKSAIAYTKYTMDIRYPLALKPQATVYALAFVEAGNSWSHIDNFNPFNVKRSAGVGVRIFLPMLGMLGVDWGYGFDKVYNSRGVEQEVGGSQFHFLIGQQF